MSCPHQPIFSCEDCIRDDIRKDRAKNGNGPSVFQRLRDALKERDELLELVQEVAKAKSTDEAWEASETCYDYLDDKKKLKLRKEVPWETFENPTCRGSYMLNNACGHCEKCKWEKDQIT